MHDHNEWLPSMDLSPGQPTTPWGQVSIGRGKRRQWPPCSSPHPSRSALLAAPHSDSCLAALGPSMTCPLSVCRQELVTSEGRRHSHPARKFAAKQHTQEWKALLQHLHGPVRPCTAPGSSTTERGGSEHSGRLHFAERKPQVAQMWTHEQAGTLAWSVRRRAVQLAGRQRSRSSR